MRYCRAALHRARTDARLHSWAVRVRVAMHRDEDRPSLQRREHPTKCFWLALTCFDILRRARRGFSLHIWLQNVALAKQFPARSTSRTELLRLGSLFLAL